MWGLGDLVLEVGNSQDRTLTLKIPLIHWRCCRGKRGAKMNMKYSVARLKMGSVLRVVSPQVRTF